MDKKRNQCDIGSEGAKCRRSSENMCSVIANGQLDQEKRIRRAVANCNERRRMQSINAGFDALRLILSPSPDGEKLSKATILQMTAKYIDELLTRVNVLENEVAVYRQSNGCHSSAFLGTVPGSPSTVRKRRSDEQDKCSDFTRRRRVDSVSITENSGIEYSSSSPNSCETHQNSPTTSFVSSASVSPTSPRHDSGGNTAARLEHLVMAIEQIEGGAQINCRDESFSSDGQSPPLPSETYWQGQSESYTYAYSSGQGSSLKPINSFTDSLVFSSVTNINTVTSPASDCASTVQTTTDYPIVAKLLNRPIPHKYLHRPQVVVNSSH